MEEPTKHEPPTYDDAGSQEPGDVGDAALNEQSPGAPETSEEAGKTRQTNIEAVRKAAENGRKPI